VIFINIERNSVIYAFLNYLNRLQQRDGSWFGNPFLTALITRIFDACDVPIRSRSTNSYLLNCLKRDFSNVLDDEVETRSEIVITLVRRELLDPQAANYFTSSLNKIDFSEPLFTPSILSRVLISLYNLHSLHPSLNSVQSIIGKLSEELENRLLEIEKKNQSINVNEILIPKIVLSIQKIYKKVNEENLASLIDEIINQECPTEVLYFLSYLYEIRPDIFEEKITKILSKLLRKSNEEILYFLESRTPERNLITSILTLCNFSCHKGIFIPFPIKSKFHSLVALKETLGKEREFITANLNYISRFRNVVELASRINVSIETVIATSALTLLEKAISKKLNELGLDEGGSFEKKWNRLKEGVRRKERRNIDSILTTPLYDARSKIVHSRENIPLYELDTIINHLNNFINNLFKNLTT